MSSNSGSSNSKPWGGGIGAWALEAERAEAEEAAAAEAAAAAAPSQSFPSLKEAAAAKPKKKKGTTLSLSEFATGVHVGPGGARHHQSSASLEPKGLTTEELRQLPTGPKERTPEELEYGRLGGGFRNYGSYGSGGGGPRGGGMPGRREEGDGSWGQGGGGRRPYGGGFEEEARRGPPSRGSDFDQMPSRADEVDNWAAGKKTFAPPPMESGRRDRYQELGGGGGSMRADEADNWSLGKKQPLTARSSGFGFRDSPSVADSDRWARGAALLHNGERERPRLVLDAPNKEAGAPATEPAKTRPSPFGAARPREDILAEKGVDWRKADSQIEAKKTSRPTSSQSSRPSSSHSSRAEITAPQMVAPEVKPRPKVNPFGDAKPREVLLEEKGKDWRKIDMELEHRGVDRPETEAEKLLKEEISHLKRALSKDTQGNINGESTHLSEEELASIREQITVREKDLEMLIHELDDKVKFGQKAVGERRPGSGAGRAGVITDRPSSRSSVSEESRSVEFTDRPRSRGSMVDIWSRPQDEKRGFHMGREGGFIGNRDMDRPKSRERW